MKGLYLGDGWGVNKPHPGKKKCSLKVNYMFQKTCKNYFKDLAMMTFKDKISLFYCIVDDISVINDFLFQFKHFPTIIHLNFCQNFFVK